MLLCLCFSSASLAAPTVFPVGEVTINKSSEIHRGYTLYLALQLNRVVLLDWKGAEVHSWQGPSVGGNMSGNVLPLPAGHIMVHVGETHHRRIVEMDWDGAVVWQYYNPNFTILHHDFDRKANGNTLILGSKFRKVPAIATREIKDDVIIEVDREGKEVWRWSTANHYSQLALSDEARKIIREGHEEDFFTDLQDVFHTNSIQTLPANVFESQDSAFKEGNILVSQRNTNIVFIIDKETKKIVWRMANQSVGQHQARMIPKTDMDGNALPGAGNIILFDNGGIAGFPRVTRLYSSVLEFNPLTRQKVWEYNAARSGQHVRRFFSPARSGVQRLPNGNTLIVEAEWGRIFQVKGNGEIVWIRQSLLLQEIKRE